MLNTSLKPWDFKLLDKGQPGRILYSRAFDSASATSVPPTKVIQMLDKLNLPHAHVVEARNRIGQLLESNVGHLDHRLKLLIDAAIKVKP